MISTVQTSMAPEPSLPTREKGLLKPAKYAGSGSHDATDHIQLAVSVPN